MTHCMLSTGDGNTDFQKNLPLKENTKTKKEPLVLISVCSKLYLQLFCSSSSLTSKLIIILFNCLSNRLSHDIPQFLFSGFYPFNWLI